MIKQVLAPSLTVIKFKLSVLAFMLVALFISSPSYAGDIARGESLSQTCLGCHGAPGLRNPGPVYNIPVIGGQREVYLVSALQAYKNKERSHGTMQAQASNLSDQDIQDIAAYFSSLKTTVEPVAADLSAAPKLYDTCKTCHSVDGAATGDFPIINGQYQSYIAQALKDYRAGGRKNPIMGMQAQNLTIQQIKEIADWYAQQQGKLIAPQTKIFK